jgi:hypothetical protein
VIHEHGKFGSELPSYYGSPRAEKPVKGSATTYVQQKGSNRTTDKVSLLDDFEQPQPITALESLLDLLGNGTETLFDNPWSDTKSPSDPHWVDDRPLSVPGQNGPADAKPRFVNTGQTTAKVRAPQVIPAHPKAGMQFKPTEAFANYGKPINFTSLHDPRIPGWNAKRYIHPIYQQYKCPMPDCL